MKSLVSSIESGHVAWKVDQIGRESRWTNPGQNWNRIQKKHWRTCSSPHVSHTRVYRAPLYHLQRDHRVFLWRSHQPWQYRIRLCAKCRRRHQPKLTEVALYYFGHVPVYILRVLKAGTKVTASGRFWSWLPLLWRYFCLCLSSWRFFFSCRCCSFLCLLDTWGQIKIQYV